MTDAIEPSLANSKTVRQLAVRAGDNGMEILLDGSDIAAKIDRVNIDLSSGLPFAEVVLQVHPKHTVAPEFEGLAHVQIGEPADPGPAAAAFLSAIDPEALEQAAFHRMDIGTGPGSGTKAMLNQLIDWANGS